MIISSTSIRIATTAEMLIGITTLTYVGLWISLWLFDIKSWTQIFIKQINVIQHLNTRHTYNYKCTDTYSYKFIIRIVSVSLIIFRIPNRVINAIRYLIAIWSVMVVVAIDADRNRHHSFVWNALETYK